MHDAAVEDAAHGDAVGEHDGDDLDRDDGVEGRGGADVDEGEKTGDGAGQDDCVYRELLAGVHVGNPFGEGKTVVSCECEGLAGCGSVP